MIVIYTPTYNRVTELKRLYNSLINQTKKQFIWAIIDDGSTDNTSELVKSWQKDNNISIHYIYKENGGKYTAINKALDKYEDNWNICVDSDDWLKPYAVERMYEDIKKIEKKENMVGIMYPRLFSNSKFEVDEFGKGKVIDGLYHEFQELNITEGDHLVKPGVYKGLRFPIFPNEKFCSLTVLSLQKLEKGNTLYLPFPIVEGEYLDDGITKNVTHLWKRNPEGYYYSRRLLYNYHINKSNHTWKAIIPLAQTIALNISLKKSLIYKLPNKLLGILIIPLGIGFWIKKYLLKK